MNFNEAMGRFDQALAAVESEHPELRGIVVMSRASASRIALRFRQDGDEARADNDLARLLLDVADAAEKNGAVKRDLPSEEEGGPPSLATLERVRSFNRRSLGVAGVRGVRGVADQTLLGAELGVTASVASQALVRSVAVRSGSSWVNRVTDWLMDVFGGPEFDIELKQPIGTVTFAPFGYGDPRKQAAVFATAFLLVAVTAYALVRACSCSPCHSRGAA